MQKLQKEKAYFQKVILQLDALSPLKTLARGYGIVYKGENRVKSISELKPQDEITICLQDGKTKAKVIEKT